MVGIWSKFGQGRKLVKKVKIWKVLRMGLPIVENLSGLQESIFSLSRGPQPTHSSEGGAVLGDTYPQKHTVKLTN